MLPIKGVVKCSPLTSETCSIMKKSFCSLFYFSREERDIWFTVTPTGSTVPEIFLLSDVLPGPFSMRIGACLPLKSPFLNNFSSLLSCFTNVKNLELCLRVLAVRLLGSRQLSFARWFLLWSLVLLPWPFQFACSAASNWPTAYLNFTKFTQPGTCVFRLHSCFIRTANVPAIHWTFS